MMPKHVHAIIRFTESTQSINTIIGNGERFMAYEIIRRLQQLIENDLIAQLSSRVEAKRKTNKKLTKVWKLSFDWKACNPHAFIN